MEGEMEGGKEGEREWEENEFKINIKDEKEWISDRVYFRIMLEGGKYLVPKSKGEVQITPFSECCDHNFIQ